MAFISIMMQNTGNVSAAEQPPAIKLHLQLVRRNNLAKIWNPVPAYFRYQFLSKTYAIIIRKPVPCNEALIRMPTAKNDSKPSSSNCI